MTDRSILDARHVVLMGLMGSGKSSVGTRLADALGRPIRDSDLDIQAATGRRVREIAASDGVERVHALEKEHLLDALAGTNPSVIGAAASTIDDAGARAELDSPRVLTIWLHVRPETVVARLRPTDHRPDFGDDLRSIATEQATRRDPLFASVADRIVDVDGRSPDEIVADLLR